MKKTVKALWWLTMLCSCPAARADTSFQLTSAALSNGWFQYELTVRWNGFFSDFYDVAMQPESFGNLDTVGETAGAVLTTNGVLKFDWPGTSPPFVIRTVTARSASPYVTMGHIFIMYSATVAGWIQYPFLSGNIVGYWRAPALVPSEAEDPEITGCCTSNEVVLIPDPEVVGLTPGTVSFTWPTNATMRIEASHDMSVWTGLVNVLYYPPATTWTSQVPLETLGNHFRVNLIAARHLTNLVTTSLSSTVSVGSPPAGSDDVAVSVAGVGEAGIQVRLRTEPGVRYWVRAVTADGRSLDHQEFLATKTSSTVALRDHGAAAPVFIEAGILK